MTIFEGILEGVIQGLTEFLPISSDGHLSLFQHFFGLSGENALFFTVMLHLGTLIAIFVAFYDTIWALIVEAFRMIGDIFKGRFRYSDSGGERRAVIMILLTLVPLLGFYLIKDWMSGLAEDSDIIVEGFCFLFTGFMLYMADRCVKGRRGAIDMKPRDALWLGFFQGFAALPGVSRSGSTISVGLMRGFSKDFIVRFSFIMSIPAVLGVCLSETVDAVREGISIELAPMLAGMLTSAVVGFFAIKLVRWLIKTDRYSIFAYYTFILGALTIIAGIIELIAGQPIPELLR